MSELKNKIDFTALVSVKMANSNGDPLNGNRPRIDYDGFGEISDVVLSARSATACRIWDTVFSCSRPIALTMGALVLESAQK